ncbi:MAG: DUF4346 domain-containing protein [bacterium]|nr:DUF4346 domain-containing protein [bacterium]
MEMHTIKANPVWIKDKKVAADFAIYEVPRWDDIKDFIFDKEGCYVLIKIYRESHDIGVAICNQEHVILKEFRGRRAQDIYSAIFKFDREHKLGWFQVVDHAAYLGKELKKAEICLALGSDYYQE